MPEALATVEDLTKFLGNPDDLDEAVASLYLDLASGEVRAATGRTFDPVEAETIYVSGEGTSVLFLPNPPITEVLSIVENPGGALENELVGPAGDVPAYEWAESGIVRRLDGLNWARRFRYYAVTYDHGFPTVPTVVSAVVLRMAARVLTNPEGIKQEAIGRYSYTRAGESAGVGLFPADVLALGDFFLDRGRR